MEFCDLETRKVQLHDVASQLRQHVYDRSLRAFAAGDEARSRIKDAAGLAERRAFMREALLERLGGMPDDNPPLAPQVTGVVRSAGFRIEKVIFSARTNTPVTANVYVPDGRTEPSGAVLFLCGHHAEAKQQPEYQAVCRHLVRAGLVAMAIDPIGQGERSSFYDAATGETVIPRCVQDHDAAGMKCWPLGDGLARYFIHDIVRAIDYLQSRPDVDPAKIGVTGNSGGGTQASLAMLADDRIAAAAPGTFIMDRESYLLAGGAQDSEQIWPGMSALGFDHADILLAMAPKPVLVLAVTYDFFPIEGTRRTVAQAKRIWELLGRGGDLELFEDTAEHSYTPAMAREAARFFARHLLGETAEVPDEPVGFLAPAELRCTESGQALGDDPQSRTVYDESVARLERLERKRAALPPERLKAEAVRWLRGKVAAGRSVPELNPRLTRLERIRHLNVHSVLWWSQAGICNHGFLFRDFRRAGERLPLTLAVWDGGTSRLQSHASRIEELCAAGRAVLAADLTGVGALAPHPVNPYPVGDRYGTLYKMTTDLFWLDDSLAAMRIFDVLRLYELAGRLPDIDPESVAVYSEGRSAMYVRLAHALHGGGFPLEITGRLPNVAEWIRNEYAGMDHVLEHVLPGMLQWFDLSEL